MSYTHLTEAERYHIDEQLRQGATQAAIAAEIGRSPSTLSRELSRNQGKRGWRPRQAHIIATHRLSERGHNNASKIDEAAWDYAIDKLANAQWSPEQISGRQKKDNLPSISHESIYQRLLADKKAGGDLYTHLRCQKKRKKRYGSKTAGRQHIPNRVDISERPAVVDKKKRFGDWEGDTIIGSHKGGAVLTTAVERKSRYLCLGKSKDKTTKSVITRIANDMAAVAPLAKTMTLDNGVEFAGHQELTNQLGMEVYFARPYHSWERGLNENTNGLIRQYFPKKTCFDNISEDEFRAVAEKINHRPRKCLGFRTPHEVLVSLSAKKKIALRI